MLITYREVLSPKLLLGVGASKTILSSGLPNHDAREEVHRRRARAEVARAELDDVEAEQLLSFRFTIDCVACFA